MSSSTVRRFIGVAAVLCLAASAAVVGSITAPGQILALPGASESTVVTVEPTRILDTRFNIGLSGQFVANTSRKLTVTGVIDTYIEATATTTVKQVIPAGATGVLLNVTAVSPTAAGFLSIRPGTATGVAATAGLNFNAGDIVPNAITVAMPITGANAGQIDIYYGTPTTGATMHVVADVVGYTTNTGLIDLTNRVVALETSGGSPVIFGGVDFIDPLDLDGYVSLGRTGMVAATPAAIGAVIPVGGTLSNLNVSLVATTGPVVVTVFVGATATTMTCTVAAAESTCSDTINKAALTAGNKISVRIENASGARITNFTWTGWLAP